MRAGISVGVSVRIYGRNTMSFHDLKRREFIGLLGGAAAWPTWARGQTREKEPVIGVLWHAANAEEEKFPLSQFRLGLQDVGYVEGKNILLENRFPAEQPERFDALAAELVHINVDILFTVTRLAALAAQRATKNHTHRVHGSRGSRRQQACRHPRAPWWKHHRIGEYGAGADAETLRTAQGSRWSVQGGAARKCNRSGKGSLGRAEQHGGWPAWNYGRADRGADAR
jgi:hypothetical protein